MKTRIRYDYRSWLEPFRYDFDSRYYVSDKRVEPRGASLLKAPRDYCAMFSEALSEIRHEFEIKPADEWEGGHLLTLYGAANVAGEATRAPRNLQLLYRDLTEAALAHQRHLLASFFEEVTYICEIVVTRHWPDAVSRLEAEIADYSPKKTDRLNLAVRQVGLQDIPRLRTVVDLWLSSLDKPDSFGYRLEITREQLVRSSSWMQTCLDAVRLILSNAGAATREMTLGIK
jgi:hypothetical protein